MFCRHILNQECAVLAFFRKSSPRQKLCLEKKKKREKGATLQWKSVVQRLPHYAPSSCLAGVLL